MVKGGLDEDKRAERRWTTSEGVCPNEALGKLVRDGFRDAAELCASSFLRSVQGDVHRLQSLLDGTGGPARIRSFSFSRMDGIWHSSSHDMLTTSKDLTTHSLIYPYTSCIWIIDREALKLSM